MNHPARLLNAQFLISAEVLKDLPLGVHEEAKAHEDHYQVNVGGFVPGLMNAVIDGAIVTHHSVIPRHSAVRERRKNRVSVSERQSQWRRAGNHLARWPTPASCLLLYGPGAKNGFTFLNRYVLNAYNYLHNILDCCLTTLKAYNIYNLVL